MTGGKRRRIGLARAALQSDHMPVLGPNVRGKKNDENSVTRRRMTASEEITSLLQSMDDHSKLSDLYRVENLEPVMHFEGCFSDDFAGLGPPGAGSERRTSEKP